MVTWHVVIIIWVKVVTQARKSCKLDYVVRLGVVFEGATTDEKNTVIIFGYFAAKLKASVRIVS